MSQKFARPLAQGVIDQSCSSSLFVIPPLSPRGPSAPVPGPLGRSLDLLKGPGGHGFCTRSVLISTFLTLAQIMKNMKKIFVFHFLLRSPVVLLFLRYLILPHFPKKHFFNACSDLGPPGDPQKIDRSFLAPLGRRLGPRTCFSRTASGPSKKRSKQKIELLKNTLDFPQKLSPGELLAIQAPPQTGPMDLHTRPEGLLQAS